MWEYGKQFCTNLCTTLRVVFAPPGDGLASKQNKKHQIIKLYFVENVIVKYLIQSWTQCHKQIIAHLGMLCYTGIKHADRLKMVMRLATCCNSIGNKLFNVSPHKKMLMLLNPWCHLHGNIHAQGYRYSIEHQHKYSWIRSIIGYVTSSFTQIIQTEFVHYVRSF